MLALVLIPGIQHAVLLSQCATAAQVDAVAVLVIDERQPRLHDEVDGNYGQQGEVDELEPVAGRAEGHRGWLGI